MLTFLIPQIILTTEIQKHVKTNHRLYSSCGHASKKYVCVNEKYNVKNAVGYLRLTLSLQRLRKAEDQSTFHQNDVHQRPSSSPSSQDLQRLHNFSVKDKHAASLSEDDEWNMNSLATIILCKISVHLVDLPINSINDWKSFTLAVHHHPIWCSANHQLCLTSKNS